MKVAFNMRALLSIVAAGLLACSSSNEIPSVSSLQIVRASGAPLSAVAGDALALKVVETMADGSTKDLPARATVSWSGPPMVMASSPDGTAADNPYPAIGATPVALWIANPSRPDRAADLAGVLFVLDAGSAAGGSVMVTATVGGATSGSASATIPVSAAPDGDAARGAMLYGSSGANCAECHGMAGEGTPMNPDGSFTIEKKSYMFPAPAIDGEMGNAAAEWSSALFAISSRADVDDGAVALRLPMPDWLGSPSPATGKSLTTQDLADIYAFLKTQK
jgi:mono/diheme cytochrome c family protein